MERDIKRSEPSLAVSAVIFFIVVALMGWLRFFVFPDQLVALTYVLPLLICLWHQDKRLLWSMAVVFGVMGSTKTLLLIPDLAHWEKLVQWLMQLTNITVAATVVHLVINLTKRLRRKSLDLEAANEELTAREQEILKQHEELQSQAEELLQQNEELQQQGEELQIQTEELRTTSELTSKREKVLNIILSSLKNVEDEPEMMACLCSSLVEIFEGACQAAAVVEKVGADLVIHASTGFDTITRRSWPFKSSFAAVVMEHDKTAYVDDLRARPDLIVPETVDDVRSSYRSVLSTPIRSGGRPIGALEVFSVVPQQWTSEQFQVIEWAAAQCSLVLEMMRTAEALKERSEHYRLALEGAGLGAWDYRFNRGTVYWDERCRNMWGIVEGEDISYEQAVARIHPDEQQAVHAAVTGAIEGTDNGVYNMEFRVVWPDRSVHWISSHGLVHFERAGSDRRAVRFIGVNADITERKRVEELLMEANRRKDEFLAMLGHELRNPLSTLVNGLTLLRMHGAEQRLPWIRESLERQTMQLTRLVDDLLEISRISRGKIKLQREKVPLVAIVDRSIEATSELIKAKEHTLDVSLPDEALWLYGDSARLQQIIANLLTNAAKYTNPGGSIRLEAKREDHRAIIKLKDNGVGIPHEEQGKIFEPFTQLNTSLDRSVGGLGIGLALVRRLAELHGGSVSVISDGPGKGSEFTVCLPLLKEPEEEKPLVQAQAIVEPQSGLRILVVEDFKDTADMLSMLLQDRGHRVSTAYDGISGLEQALAQRPDVILLDIGLPKLDGYAVAKKLREAGLTRTVIIAATGYGQEQDRAKSFEAGFDHHLVKPVTYEAMAPLLAACESRQLKEDSASADLL